jgi:hypothetical protein
VAVFREYVDRLLDKVPTILRKKADNVLFLWHQILYEGADKNAEALDEYITTSWPLNTASGWVLDQHWGPMHNIPRNGMDDATYRLYIHAKRMLNASWGAADQGLKILRFLLGPVPTLTFTFFGNKHWEIAIGGIDMADAALALEFMRKRPSPQGGGFSVAGDNGWGKTWDANVMTFSSLNGPVPITGSWSSLQGPSGGLEAGWAHIVNI